MHIHDESSKIKDRYAKRQNHSLYSYRRPEVQYSHSERIRKIVFFLNKKFPDTNFSDLKCLEIGSGSGHNLLDFIRIGFSPINLSGIELIAERDGIAKTLLPVSVKLHCADAIFYDYDHDGYDIVFQSVVFSSLLDNKAQKLLAEKMWSILRPGGIILWYDFIYNNPANKDVRGVSLNRVRELFPLGKLNYQSLTLAPPISRLVCSWFPKLYPFLNTFPFLRTHKLIVITKRE